MSPTSTSYCWRAKRDENEKFTTSALSNVGIWGFRREKKKTTIFEELKFEELKFNYFKGNNVPTVLCITTP